jgi:transporter family protein
MLLTLVSWGVWAILSRPLESVVTPAQSQAMSTLGVAPILLALWWLSEPNPTANANRGRLLAFGSGLISCIGNIAYYGALSDAKAATLVPLTALFPVVTILLAVQVLKERVTAIQWVGVALSVAAIPFFFPPGEQRGVSAWMLAALVALVLWGVASLLQKASTFTLSGSASAFWFLMAFVPIGVGILAWRPVSSSLDVTDWALAAALGFTLAFGNFTILVAYAVGGKATVIAPLSGLYPLVSIPIAIVAFGEPVGARELTGIVLALVAVVLLAAAPDPTVADSSLEGEQLP